MARRQRIHFPGAHYQVILRGNDRQDIFYDEVGRYLSRIIQNLAFRYTRWINSQISRVGHLFQGRYRTILVDADEYFL